MNAHLSDLFFNHEHPARDKLYGTKGGSYGQGVSEDEVRQALVTDAAEFAASVEGAFGVKLDADELAADFLRRV